MNPIEQSVKYLKQLAELEPEIVLDLSPKNSPRSLNSSPLNESAAIAEKRSLLAEVEALALQCTKCELCQGRNKVVFGVGNPAARLMFIGEGPGADEDRLGEPFVGRAGQLLNKIIVAMGLSREEVYIANIVKCRPPGNRNPTAQEAALCMPYLHRQIEIISPDLIVALGLVSATYLLELPPTTAVKSIRGRLHEFNGKPLIVTYHPAALLRNPTFKQPTWQDMLMAMRYLNGEIKWSASSSTSPETSLLNE